MNKICIYKFYKLLFFDSDQMGCTVVFAEVKQRNIVHCNRPLPVPPSLAPLLSQSQSQSTASSILSSTKKQDYSAAKTKNEPKEENRKNLQLFNDALVYVSQIL